MTLLPRVDEYACCGHGDCAAIAPSGRAMAAIRPSGCRARSKPWGLRTMTVPSG